VTRTIHVSRFTFHKNVMSHTSSPQRRIAYALQSVSVDLAAEAGPAVLIRHTIEELRQAGHQVTILALRGREMVGLEGPAWPGTARPLPLGMSGGRPFKTVESGLRRLQSEVGLPYLGLFESRRFYEGARRALPRYDLCHEYHTLFSLGPTLACRRLRLPHLLTVDADLLLESELVGRPIRGIQAALAKWAARLTFRSATTLICVSAAAKAHFVRQWQIPAAKIAVVPNGVDTAAFSPCDDPRPVRARLGLTDGPLVMFVGGFQPWHGLELLVEAFARVAHKRPDAKLLLVGDGPARPAAEAAIASLKLEKNVHITGYVAHEAMPTWLAAADVAVAPYPALPQELWFSPLKLYEYMAAGKAIVASAAGQIAEVIEDGHNGRLVRPGDVAELAQAIGELLDDPAGRQELGRAARQQAVSQHSWQVYRQRLESLYTAALEGTG
jgi:glycosyltransferase involved in cell wall biosynthesis